MRGGETRNVGDLNGNEKKKNQKKSKGRNERGKSVG